MGNTLMKFRSDIDIDFGNRDLALDLLDHHPASIIKDGKITRHNTGVYFQSVPVDPFSGNSAIDYQEAEQRGYAKLDFLNVSLYSQIKNRQQLDDLMRQDPPWHMLYEPEFCAQLIHINGHYDTLIKMPEAVTSVPRMAMFLSVIRPAKRHLVGLTWAEVAKTVWDRPSDDGYYFKKSHAIAYANLVVVNMNLLNFTNKSN